MTMVTCLIKLGFDVSFLWRDRKLIIRLEHKGRIYEYMYDEIEVYRMRDFDYVFNTRLYDMAEAILEQENI